MNKKPVCVCVAQPQQNKNKNFHIFELIMSVNGESTMPTIYIILKILLQ